MSIQFFNIRLGFATNSSSTHSICFVGNNNMPENVYPHFDHFGWDDFTLATPAMKQSYILTLLHSELSKQVGSFLADKTINGWYSGQYPEATALIKKDYSGIDHQSRIVLPRFVTPFYNESTFINEEFVEDLMNFVSSDRCVILGGNDNSDGHPLAEQYNKINFPTEQDDKFWRAKKDGKVWVLFNKENGSKFRFSFEQEKLEYNKSYVPELVDIKITDWCDKGCVFCLTGDSLISTPLGFVPIKDVDIGKQIITYNFVDSCEEIHKVDQVFKRDYTGDLITIELEDGKTLTLTPNHEIFTTNRGWVHAVDLLETDDIQTTNTGTHFNV